MKHKRFHGLPRTRGKGRKILPVFFRGIAFSLLTFLESSITIAIKFIRKEVEAWY